MQWKDWALIGPALLVLAASGTFIIVGGIIDIFNEDFVGIVEVLFGSVLNFLAVYFFIMLWRLKI